MKSLRSALDFACVAAPKLVGGGCLVALNISLTKWIGPDVYGMYSICLAALSLLSEGLFGAAIDMGVIRLAPLHLQTDPTRALQIEKTALKLKVWAVGGFSLILIALSVPLSQLAFHRAGTWHLIAITCLAALGALCFSSALLHFQIRGNFLRYGVLDASQILVKFGGIALLIYYATATSQSLQLGQLLIWFAIAPILACALFYLLSGRRLREVPRGAGHQLQAELLDFIRWFFFTLLITSVIARIDVLALTAYCTIEDVGLYSAGQTIAMIPMLFGFYLCVILSPKIMPYCRSGKFFGLLWRVQTALVGMSVVGYAVLLWNSKLVTEYLLPHSFAPSYQVIYILLPATLAGMTSLPLAVSFLMFIRPKFLVTVDLILLPFLLLGYALTVPRHGAVGAAVVTCSFGIIKTGIAQFETFRLARKTPAEMGLADVAEDSNLCLNS
jgi:O-antigen/teichoic acid export membrane protein